MMSKARCQYWEKAEAYANGDAEMIELTDVPCGRCSECRRAASDGLLASGELAALYSDEEYDLLLRTMTEEQFNGGQEAK
jgi:hypothetical protein